MKVHKYVFDVCWAPEVLKEKLQIYLSRVPVQFCNRKKISFPKVVPFNWSYRWGKVTCGNCLKRRRK